MTSCPDSHPDSIMNLFCSPSTFRQLLAPWRLLYCIFLSRHQPMQRHLHLWVHVMKSQAQAASVLLTCAFALCTSAAQSTCSCLTPRGRCCMPTGLPWKDCNQVTSSSLHAHCLSGLQPVVLHHACLLAMHRCPVLFQTTCQTLLQCCSVEAPAACQPIK